MPGELIFPELLQDINVLVGVKLVKIHHHEYKRFIHHMSLKSMHQNLMKIVYFGRALLMNNASLPFINITSYIILGLFLYISFPEIHSLERT